MIDVVVGGKLNVKMLEGSMKLFEELAMNSYQWYSSRAKSSKIAHVYDVDTVTTLAMQMENLNKKIDGLMVTK